MGYHYASRDDVLCTPAAVIAFAWSAPMRDLAARVGLSDVGLKKLLVGYGIPTPPQGHWNKVAAGKAVQTPPPAPPRAPGQHPLLRLGARFAGEVEAADPLPPDGPFPSPIVPDDLEELRRLQLRKIGKVAAPRDLKSPHAAIRAILARDEKYRAAKANDRWAFHSPEFDDPLYLRRLRILNGLLTALGRAGHPATVNARERDLDVSVWIGSTRVSIYVGLPADRRARQYHQPVSPLAGKPTSTKLRLTIAGDVQTDGIETWVDTDGSKIEQRLTEIAAAMVVEGERSFRRGVRARYDADVEWQRYQEEERARKRVVANAERLKQLRLLSAELNDAGLIRAMIAQVKMALDASVAGAITSEEFDGWYSWATAEADRIDPIKSGKIVDHVRGASEK